MTHLSIVCDSDGPNIAIHGYPLMLLCIFSIWNGMNLSTYKHGKLCISAMGCDNNDVYIQVGTCQLLPWTSETDVSWQYHGWYILSWFIFVYSWSLQLHYSHCLLYNDLLYDNFTSNAALLDYNLPDVKTQ